MNLLSLIYECNLQSLVKYTLVFHMVFHFGMSEIRHKQTLKDIYSYIILKKPLIFIDNLLRVGILLSI